MLHEEGKNLWQVGCNGNGGVGNEWFGEFRRHDRQDLAVGDFGGMSNKWCTWGSDSGIQSFTPVFTEHLPGAGAVLGVEDPAVDKTD